MRPEYLPIYSVDKAGPSSFGSRCLLVLVVLSSFVIHPFVPWKSCFLLLATYIAQGDLVLAV